MLYRRCPDISPLSEEEIDTPEMVEAAAAVGRDEADLRMLQRLAELGMELAEEIAQNAKARLRAAAAAAEGAAPNPGPEPTALFIKMAQAVRRTIALKRSLDEAVKTGRCDLAIQREKRRDRILDAQVQTMDEVIETTFCESLGEDYAEPEGPETEVLRRDMREVLSDADEFQDYLERPVGETVAKLRAAMGLDPTPCVLDGTIWRVRRAPYAFEAAQMAAAGEPAPPYAAANPSAASLAAAATGPPG
jgi:hypothetical protein